MSNQVLMTQQDGQATLGAKAIQFASATSIMLFMATPAFAKDLQGGISEATGLANSSITAIMALVGVLAAGYLLWKALDAWQGRSDWKEFGLSVVYVAIAGASVILARWAWTFFTS